MTLTEVLQHFEGVTSNGSGQYMAKCPAHPDKKASLSISQGDKGGIVLHCFAGCDNADILAAAGLTQDDIRAPKADKPAGKRIVAIYSYTDDAGKMTHQKIRYSDKSFTWRQPKGDGWQFNRNGIAPTLYASEKPLPDAVFLVEGEKDVDTLKACGVPACSVPNGAKSKWEPQFTDMLRGKEVYIIPDNDAPGMELAKRAANELKGAAKCVKLLDLKRIWPEIPEKGDASDLIAHMGKDDGIAALLGLVRDTEAYEPQYTGRIAVDAEDFSDEETSFLWYPYLPIGEYTVMMADGGTGKTILCCGIAAYVSNGKSLPGDAFDGEGRNVLIISSEDPGSVLKKRLMLSGANTRRVKVLDCIGSEGMNIADKYDEFETTVKHYKPSLVIIDPWHAFLGANVDISRANALRPILQKIANLAKSCDCSVVLVSHVNKRAQGENANNAATGSADLVNAARSAFRVIFDETDEDCRIMVHTKSNYAPYGRSVKYRIVDGGVKWEGFSEVTRQTLEASARRHSTPFEVMQKGREQEAINNSLVEALEASANQFEPVRFSYDEFKRLHSDMIFGGIQPKRALDAVQDRLSNDGYFLRTGIQVRKDRKNSNGFLIQRVATEEATQTEMQKSAYMNHL